MTEIVFETPSVPVDMSSIQRNQRKRLVIPFFVVYGLFSTLSILVFLIAKNELIDGILINIRDNIILDDRRELEATLYKSLSLGIDSVSLDIRGQTLRASKNIGLITLSLNKDIISSDQKSPPLTTVYFNLDILPILEIELGLFFILLILFYFYSRSEIIRQHRHIVLMYELSAERLITTLSKQVAHDIRSPLSAINLAVASIKDAPVETKELIQNASLRLNDIANDLLLTSKAKNQKSLLPVTEVLKSILTEKSVFIASTSRIQFTDNIEPSTCLVNGSEFGRAISNILNNSIEALKNIPAGKIHVQASSQNEFFVISISDNGPGIKDEVLQKLRRMDVVSDGKGLLGSGLGLRHAFEFMKTAGGSLDIESTESSGTTVLLRLKKN